MEILSVALKNFKIHQDRYFEFQSGTNAICGENGAGKTSILEAIAWVLFDYSSDYNLADIIRNGTSSADVIVTFMSSSDGCTYQIKRTANKTSSDKTSSSYRIFKIEPQAEKLEVEKKEDVLRWLKKHLGVPADTELKDLFKNTIGIPQGTFTLDFLEKADGRKRAFDPILRVEDYKQTYNDSSGLETYARSQVRDLDQKISHYEDRLRDWADLKQEYKNWEQSIQQDEITLQQLDRQLQIQGVHVEQLKRKAGVIQQLSQQLEKLKAQICEKNASIQRVQETLQRSHQASELCDRHRASYQQYQSLEADLQGLSRARQQKEELEQQRMGYEATLHQTAIELAGLQTQLENFQGMRQELARLLPLVQNQIELEQQQAGVEQQLREFSLAEVELKKVEKQLAQKRPEFSKLTQEIQQIQGLESSVARIPELEQQVRRYQEQLGRVGAARQFELELRQMVTIGQKKGDRYLAQVQTTATVLQELQQAIPLYTEALDSALAVFRSGADLTREMLESLQQILADLAIQVNEAQIQQQLKVVKTQLASADQQRLKFMSLPDKLEQQSRLGQEIEQLQAHLQQLQTDLARKPDWQSQREQGMAQLRQLDNPRGRKQILERQLEKEQSLQENCQRVQLRQGELQHQIDRLQLQLQDYQDLSARITSLEASKKAEESGYLLFLQNQNQAANLATCEQELQEINQQLQILLQEQANQEFHYAELAATYNPQDLKQQEEIYRQIEKNKYQLEGSLPEKRRQFQQLQAELEQREQLARKCDRVRQERRKQERIYQFLRDAREVYSSAGPRITKLFTEKISQEADKIFRELLGRQDSLLRWTEDYEIQMQEGGNWRGFKNLSGGEQMCAALAVRLALIRILADIDLVFLDEPTTNMDENRRRQLAQAVGNITNFRQLFVISHDDTFETIADNVILVEREPIV